MKDEPSVDGVETATNGLFWRLFMIKSLEGKSSIAPAPLRRVVSDFVRRRPRAAVENNYAKEDGGMRSRPTRADAVRPYVVAFTLPPKNKIRKNLQIL